MLGKGSYMPTIQAQAASASPNLLLAVFVESDDEMTSLGMTEELVNNLSRLRNVRLGSEKWVSCRGALGVREG